ncbi:hypothetical protein BGX27_010496 [Mortierella sp. AM989]|nr:hypothetical protein BGX27_010496 [Mortierella sp. AM989]
MSEMDIDHEPSNGGTLTPVEAGQSEESRKRDELEHLFDLDDSEVIKAENPWMTRTAPVELFNAKNANVDDLAGDSPRQFMLFYRHFFPAKSYFRWLNYDNSMTPSKAFMNREFAFFLTNDSFMRFQSYKNLDDFKNELIRLCPTRIDLGAIYNIRPKDKNMVRAGALVAVAKEMVFDIDMTDYDEIRTCCSGGDVCVKCWEFMTVAMKVIDAALKEDFGFKHLLWVYSGRRGVHCWVGDERARVMNNEQRKSIISYLEVIKGGANQGKKVKLPNTLHPSLKRSYAILKKHFGNIVFSSQDILTTPKNWEKILAIIPDEAIKAQVRASWEEDPDSTPFQKWEQLQEITGQAAADAAAKKSSKKKPQTESKNKPQTEKPLIENIPRDIIFQFTYPRLDEKVSMDIKHLLKSPFCIHPKTGRVCIPIPIETCDKFDPSSSPTVPQLVRELNEYDEKHQAIEGRKLQDWQKTSLRRHVEVFTEFVDGILHDIAEKKRDEASKSLNF